MNTNGVPNTNHICKQINQLNKKWNLKPTLDDLVGVQLSFKESLEAPIVRLQHAGDLNNRETIKIKVSGDGTNIGKRLTIVNFTLISPFLIKKLWLWGEKAICLDCQRKPTETYMKA